MHQHRFESSSQHFIYPVSPSSSHHFLFSLNQVMASPSETHLCRQCIWRPWWSWSVCPQLHSPSFLLQISSTGCHSTWPAVQRQRGKGVLMLRQCVCVCVFITFLRDCLVISISSDYTPAQVLCRWIWALWSSLLKSRPGREMSNKSTNHKLQCLETHTWTRGQCFLNPKYPLLD